MGNWNTYRVHYLIKDTTTIEEIRSTLKKIVCAVRADKLLSHCPNRLLGGFGLHTIPGGEVLLDLTAPLFWIVSQLKGAHNTTVKPGSERVVL